MNNPVMTNFKRTLLTHALRIKRAAYLTGLDVVDLAGGDFKLVGTWNGGKFEKTYTRESVLGRFISSPPLQQRPYQRVCNFRDQFIQEALSARGV